MPESHFLLLSSVFAPFFRLSSCDSSLVFDTFRYIYKKNPKKQHSFPQLRPTPAIHSCSFSFLTFFLLHAVAPPPPPSKASCQYLLSLHHHFLPSPVAFVTICCVQSLSLVSIGSAPAVLSFFMLQLTNNRSWRCICNTSSLSSFLYLYLTLWTAVL